MLSDGEFRQLLDHFDRPWSGYRKVRKAVKKRVRRHMKQLDTATVPAYLRRLEADAAEMAVCRDHLRVTISRLFREAELWRHLLERLIPDLAAAGGSPLRLWSAGCACGEEAYSLAIVCAQLPAAPPVDLLATDAKPHCLARARLGVFNRSSLRELPNELREAYFSPLKGGRRCAIRTGALPPIRWRVHNLFEPPPPGPFHLILLRNNLLTYHRGPRLRAAVEKIVAALAPGGRLVVGARERPPALSPPLRRDPECPWVYAKTS